jgi:hypothetical protein
MIQGSEIQSLSDAQLSMISGGRMKHISAVPPNVNQPSGQGFSQPHPDQYWSNYNLIAHELL